MQLLFRLISVVGAAFVGATFNQGTLQTKVFGAFFFFFFFFFFITEKTVPVERMWVLYLGLKGLLGNIKVF